MKNKLMAHKIMGAIESKRSKGNTTFLIHATACNNVGLVVDKEFTANLFNQDGYKNATTIDNIDKFDYFVLDNGTVYTALKELLHYIDELESKLNKNNEITFNINTNITTDSLEEIINKNTSKICDVLKEYCKR